MCGRSCYVCKYICISPNDIMEILTMCHNQIDCVNLPIMTTSKYCAFLSYLVFVHIHSLLMICTRVLHVLHRVLVYGCKLPLESIAFLVLLYEVLDIDADKALNFIACFISISDAHISYFSFHIALLAML